MILAFGVVVGYNIVDFTQERFFFKLSRIFLGLALDFSGCKPQ